MKKLDNKGFTLVELLAVVVILVVIMAIAIPNISSSIERSNAKKDKAMEKVLKSEAELYISKHKASVKQNLKDSNTDPRRCFISIDALITDGYLSDEDVDDYKDSCLIYDGSVFVVSSLGGTSEVPVCKDDENEDVEKKCY